METVSDVVKPPLKKARPFHCPEQVPKTHITVPPRDGITVKEHQPKRASAGDDMRGTPTEGRDYRIRPRRR